MGWRRLLIRKQVEDGEDTMGCCWQLTQVSAEKQATRASECGMGRSAQGHVAVAGGCRRQKPVRWSGSLSEGRVLVKGMCG